MQHAVVLVQDISARISHPVRSPLPTSLVIVWLVYAARVLSIPLIPSRPVMRGLERGLLGLFSPSRQAIDTIRSKPVVDVSGAVGPKAAKRHEHVHTDSDTWTHGWSWRYLLRECEADSYIDAAGTRGYPVSRREAHCPRFTGCPLVVAGVLARGRCFFRAIVYVCNAQLVAP